MKKIVITGGPCSGKTTIIEELRKKGFPILEETAKEIVEKRRDFPFTEEEAKIRQNLIFNEQLRKEELAEKQNYETLLLDRSIIDGLAYVNLYCNENYKKEFSEKIKNTDYDLILLFELLPFESEGFRSKNENVEEARKIHDSLYNSYKGLGYNIIIVPKMSVEERINFVLEKINLLQNFV